MTAVEVELSRWQPLRDTRQQSSAASAADLCAWWVATALCFGHSELPGTYLHLPPHGLLFPFLFCPCFDSFHPLVQAAVLRDDVYESLAHSYRQRSIDPLLDLLDRLRHSLNRM